MTTSSPPSAASGVMSEILSHECALVRTRMDATWVAVVPWVVKPRLVHQLMAVAVRIHLLPVVLTTGRRATSQTSQMAHCRVGRVRRATSNNRRSFVGPVRVLLHVLGQVGLLGVALTTVRADVGFQVL